MAKGPYACKSQKQRAARIINYAAPIKYLALNLPMARSRARSVSIETRLADWTTEVQFPTEAMMGFFSHHCVASTQALGAHSAYPMGSGGSYPGGKVARP
jgi:hypothetical protein